MNNKEISKFIKETVETLDFIPVEILFSRNGGKQTIKIVIYSKEKEIGSDDCAKVSSIVSRRLEVEELIHSSYDLIVESPGAERKLTKKEDYRIFSGREVAVYPKQPKKFNIRQDFFTGILKGLSEDEEMIVLETKKGILEIPFDDFNRCNLYFDIKKYLKSGGK